MRLCHKLVSAIPATLALVVTTTAGGAADTDQDAPYIPTPYTIVNRMLEMAEAGPGDVVYDLGSGDGRFVITAVRDFDVSRAVGIEIDPELVEESRDNAQEAGVADRTEFRQQDFFESDFSDADVVTMYLLSSLNLRLRPRLLSELEPGTRVVSHAFDMDGWEPDRSVNVADKRVYMWIVPAPVEGHWYWSAGDRTFATRLDQSFQEVEASVVNDGAIEIDTATVQGRQVRFEGRIEGQEGSVPLAFEGEWSAGRIAGRMSIGERETRATARRLPGGGA